MIIVEDGSGVVGANSYADITTARAFASNRGVQLSTVDSDVETLLTKAMDYLEALRAEYKGKKVLAATQWPRTGVYIDGVLQSEKSIPIELVNAQCQLVLEQHNGVVISPTRKDPFVTFEKIGPIETKYSENVATSVFPDMSAVDNWLAVLITDYNCQLRTLRI